MWVRGYSNDTGTTFILERVHSISIYSSVFYRNEFFSPNKSFRIELILIFNPNEILVLVRNLILVSCKPKTGELRSGLKLANRFSTPVLTLLTPLLTGRHVQKSFGIEIGIVWGE